MDGSRARIRQRNHNVRTKRVYDSTAIRRGNDWSTHADLDGYGPWLMGGGLGSPPRVLERAVQNFDHPVGPSDHGTVFICDGGGGRLNAFAPPIVLNLKKPTIGIGSSAGSEVISEAQLAGSGVDFLRSLGTIATFPWRQMVQTDDYRFGFPQASAAELEALLLARTGEATFKDVELRETVPGLEGWKHSHQVTIAVGFVHASKVGYLRDLEEPLQPGEVKEVSFWDATIGALAMRGMGTYLQQYVFPRDMYSHNPNDPNEPGPLAHHLRAVIGSDKMQDIDRWVAKQYIAHWNANSMRNPMGFKALAIGLPGGHVMIIADGQMLGLPSLLRPGENAPADIFAARTMLVDTRHRYKNREVREIDLSGEKLGAMDVTKLTPEMIEALSLGGVINGLNRDDELKWAFNQPWEPLGPPDGSHMPLTDRVREDFAHIMFYNWPAFAEAGVVGYEKLRDVTTARPLEMYRTGIHILGSVLGREGVSILPKRHSSEPILEFEHEGSLA